MVIIIIIIIIIITIISKNVCSLKEIEFSIIMFCRNSRLMKESENYHRSNHLVQSCSFTIVQKLKDNTYLIIDVTIPASKNVIKKETEKKEI